MTTPTLALQRIGYRNGATPTFTAAIATEYISLNAGVFLICYNSSDTIPASCVLTPPSGSCINISLPVGGEEVYIGPFDVDVFGTILEANFPTLLPYETNCVVKYSTWPASGTAVTNEGSAGSAYNGTAYDNDYNLLASGATSFKFDTSTDYINIPKGSAIDNLQAVTFEYAFYYVGSGTAATFFWKSNNFYAFINGTGQIVFYRTDAAGPDVNCLWHTPTNTIVTGGWYDIQIAWDSTSFCANPPVILVNNVSQTLTEAPSGSTTSWYDDSGSDVRIGSSSAAGGVIGTIALFRLHNAVLTDAQLTQNYEADKWRMGL